MFLFNIKTYVRIANVDDALEIATVHVKTWQCAYRGQIPDAYLDSLSIEKRTERWKKQLKNPQKVCILLLLRQMVRLLDGVQ